MVYPGLYKVLPVVAGLVQPDDRGHVPGLEERNVRLRRKRVVLEELVRLRNWPCEGNYLVGNDPGEVSVFDLGVEVVIVILERVQLEQLILHGPLARAHDVEHCDPVRARAHARVSKRRQRRRNFTDYILLYVGRLSVQNAHHKHRHQRHGVGPVLEIGARIVHDPLLLQRLVF